MRLRRSLRPALITAAAGVACLAFATPAVAADDPHGNNGTVKIDTVDVDDQDDNNHANHPHVPCDFQVRFFDFDLNQEAKITFTIHPPSGNGDVLLSETRTVSKDAATGGQDEDEIFQYSGNDFGLDKYKAQPQQGYHVKLTIESDGVPGGVKHKVFWLECKPTPTTPSSPPPTTPGSPPPTTPGNPPPSSPGGNGGGGLPVTGVAAGGIALAGLVLIGGGGALLFLRRRRDDVTFTA
jgi:LPXTG-motif cell wall-anchored protein